MASFTGLKIKDQVEFINKELENNKSKSLKKICKDFGLNRVKINNKFNKAGYIYDANIRCYTQDKLIQKNNKSISNVKHKEIEIIKPVVKKNNLININEFKSTFEEIKELLELKDSLKEVIQYYNKNKNVIDVPVTELKIDSDRFAKDLSNRLVKVYTNINENWMKFCKKYKQYKMQDLYSQALLEFMDKYKK